MVTTTRAQREALKRVYLRLVNDPGNKVGTDLPYRVFRKLVQPGPDCIMVPFAGMWLGIEPDGYTHS
jgi:hypothetical protein